MSVFITGESGTGKEVLARAVHHFSDRAAQPFVPFNCTAVPKDMLESQPFRLPPRILHGRRPAITRA